MPGPFHQMDARYRCQGALHKVWDGVRRLSVCIEAVFSLTSMRDCKARLPGSLSASLTTQTWHGSNWLPTNSWQQRQAAVTFGSSVNCQPVFSPAQRSKHPKCRRQNKTVLLHLCCAGAAGTGDGVISGASSCSVCCTTAWQQPSSTITIND